MHLSPHGSKVRETPNKGTRSLGNDHRVKLAAVRQQNIRLREIVLHAFGARNGTECERQGRLTLIISNLKCLFGAKLMANKPTKILHY